MKIKNIYISSFGGIKDLKLDFSDGFNLVFGENENGKTTVMAFIKMMFYGSDRGSAQIAKNIRKKYTPWDGSPMAGSIDFELNGRNYRLEREFRATNSTDKVTLYDLNLGDRQVVPGDIGAKLFGLSAAAFERSVFVGQSVFGESDPTAEGEINSKLSNLALTGDESISFETVNSRLEKAKTALMSKRGKTGEYDKNLLLCNQLKQKIQNAEVVQEDIKNKTEQKTALETKTEELCKKAAELKAIVDSENDIKNKEKLKEYLELKNQLDSINKELCLKDGSPVDEMFLRKLKFCISRVDAAKVKSEAKKEEKQRLEKNIISALNPPADASPEKASQLKTEISQIQKQINETETQINALEISKKECDNSQSNKTKGKGIIFLIIGLALIALATGLFVAKLIIPSVIATVLGIASVIAFPISLNISKKAAEKILNASTQIADKITQLQNKKNDLQRDIATKNSLLEIMNVALNSNTAILENQRQLLKEIELETTELETMVKEESDELLALFTRFKDCTNTEEIVNSIEEISKIAEKQKAIKQNLTFLSRDLNGISYEEAARKLEEMGGVEKETRTDFNELKANYEALVSQISDNKSLIATIAAEIKSDLSHAEDSERIKKELSALTEKVNSQEEFCRATDIAMEVLLESFGEVRKSYGSVLEQTAGEIFSSLSGGKYDSVSISKAFQINVTEKDAFGSRESAYLSTGCTDQAYLSLRLALSKLIFAENEALPIFLDDVLAQYDDKRTIIAMEYLKTFAEHNQIIMFTCHGAICEEGKKLSIEVKNLR